jgi:hypothetical protein
MPVTGDRASAPLAVPASAMSEAAAHARVEIGTSEVGETCAVVSVAIHTMARAVAEFAVPAIVQSKDAVRISVIAISILAWHDAAVNRIVYVTDGTSVLAGIG